MEQITQIRWIVLIVSCVWTLPAFGVSLTRGPYLQSGSSTNVVVRWRTDGATDSRVRYGTSVHNLNRTADNSVVTTAHAVRVSGLSPGTKYYYSIGTSSSALAGGESSYYFRTSPEPGAAAPTRIWVIGDSGTADENAAAVRDAYLSFVASQGANLWLMLGDNAYDDGTDEEYQAAVFEMYPTILRNTVLWPTFGNHDDAADPGNETGPYFDIFSLPRAGEAGGLASGTEAYYSFNYGNIHFVCLESYTRSSDAPMLTWLDHDLDANTKPWIIAFWHHPPYSKGSHDSDQDSELIEMRQNALPILEAHGVDLVLCGHSHSYERSKLIDGHYGFSDTLTGAMIKDGGNGRENGTGAYQKPADVGHEGAVYAVAGCSGHTGSGDFDHPVMVTSLDTLGSMLLDIDGNRLDAKFIDSNATVRDFFTILKGPAPPVLPTVTIVASDSSASEPGIDTGRFTVTRTGRTNVPLTVNYTLGGTATPGIDFSNVTRSVIILAGGTNATITIRPFDDLLLECRETVVATLSRTSNYVLGASSNAVVTISDNELPTVSIVASDPSASEPGVDTGRFTVRRAGCANVPLTVNYTLGGTATPGIDFSNVTRSVTILAGRTNATITIRPFDDLSLECRETVVATLSRASNCVLGASSNAVVTISDNELPTVNIVASDPSASEPGIDTGRFTVRRIGCTNVPLTVNYNLSGTATGGIDYSNLIGSVTIPIGFTNAAITVKPFDDALAEGPETVIATLSNRPHYLVGTPSNATVTIADNDSSAATAKTTGLFDPASSPSAASAASSTLVKTWEGSGFLTFHEDFAIKGHGIAHGCAGIWTIYGTWAACGFEHGAKGVLKHPGEWGSYRELMGERRRYRLINLQKLLDRLGFETIKEFRNRYSNDISRALTAGVSRDPTWTESLAVGSKGFVEGMSQQWPHRRELFVEERSGTWTVREAGLSYCSLLDAKSRSRAFGQHPTTVNSLPHKQLLWSDPEQNPEQNPTERKEARA